VTQIDISRCEEVIGYRFVDADMLRLGLTHASAADTRITSNERLEFLGDAVLGMVICQEIYERNPHLPEGEMTKIKSMVVSRETCARRANESGLIDLLVLGKGLAPAANLPTSLPAAVFEAVIGAIYIDGGLDAARAFILGQMDEEIEAATVSEHQRNYKSLLQKYAQRHYNAAPQYDLLDEKGPEHAKCFEIAVRLSGRQYPSAWGNSKKQAEQKAALAALRKLGVLAEAEAESPANDADPDYE